MMGLIRKLRAAPWIAFYQLRSPSRRNYARQWESYWGSVQRTGTEGDVVWDSEEAEEAAQAVAALDAHAEYTLPLLDLGCGSGRRTAALAEHFGTVIGVDVSERALDLARAEHAGAVGLSFEVLDITDTEAVRAMAERYGPMNVHARGVMHLIVEADRTKMVENLALLLGDRGVLYYVETDGGGARVLPAPAGRQSVGVAARHAQGRRTRDPSPRIRRCRPCALVRRSRVAHAAGRPVRDLHHPVRPWSTRAGAGLQWRRASGMTRERIESAVSRR